MTGSILRMCAIASLIFCSVALAESKQAKWDDVEIIGSLGKPLGTWIRIEGVVPSKAVMMANPFEVRKVNGVELTTPVLIEMKCDGKLKPGGRYVFRGYETGAMESTPTDPENPSAGQPQQSYHFGVWFEGGSVAKD
jgi:hypothetical protein